MRIGLIGLGAIGSFLAKSLPECEFIAYDIDANKAKETIKKLKLKNVKLTHDISDVKKIDLLVEAASQDAVPLVLPFLKHSDVLIMSVGALTDEKLLKKLEKTAKKYCRRVLMPSGAIGGLDVLKACNPQQVVLETRKNPESLGRKDDKETVLFDGPADEACKKFPKNVNVAATLALAGVGFKKTRVRVISDPFTSKNTHTVRIKGETGKYEFVFENFPFEENPRTSALAAHSALAIIREREKPIQIG